MMHQINALTAEQAQRALLSFYDLLPDQYWEGAVKPAPVALKAAVEEVQEEAPVEIQTLIDSLLSEEAKELKGEAAKILLQKLAGYPSLCPQVEQALADAGKAHMAPVPLIIGSVLVALGAMTLDWSRNTVTVVRNTADGREETVTTKEQQLHFNLEKLADVVRALAELAKQLPKDLLGSSR